MNGTVLPALAMPARSGPKQLDPLDVVNSGIPLLNVEMATLLCQASVDSFTDGGTNSYGSSSDGAGRLPKPIPGGENSCLNFESYQYQKRLSAAPLSVPIRAI